MLSSLFGHRSASGSTFLTSLALCLCLLLGEHAVVAVEAVIPTNGLVAYYPFSGYANDESGNGNHGNVYQATLTADRFGNANRAYSFNGSAYINVLSSSSFELAGNSISVCVWMNPTNSRQSLPMVLLSKYDASGCEYLEYTDSRCNASTPAFFSSTTSVWQCTSCRPSLEPGKFYHICYSFRIQPQCRIGMQMAFSYVAGASPAFSKFLQLPPLLCSLALLLYLVP